MSRSHTDIEQGRKVYIGNLDPGMSPDELQSMFTKYGAIAAVWVARNPPGFAFVTFEDGRDAEDAVQAMDGTKYNNKHMRVEVARGSRGGGGGGGGGGGRSGQEFKSSRDDRGGGGGGGGGRDAPAYSRRSPSYGRYPQDRDGGGANGYSGGGGRSYRDNNYGGGGGGGDYGRGRSRSPSRDRVGHDDYRGGGGEPTREGGRDGNRPSYRSSRYK
eukprot:GHVS01032678.1.p1 GENE.GHVS01032678.1~~GHVS01032678.1.p1  ORF type:complete len:215 (+),score=50.82 GHVS01032678.1:202-846(+)